MSDPDVDLTEEGRRVLIEGLREQPATVGKGSVACDDLLAPHRAQAAALAKVKEYLAALDLELWKLEGMGSGNDLAKSCGSGHALIKRAIEDIDDWFRQPEPPPHQLLRMQADGTA